MTTRNQKLAAMNIDSLRDIPDKYLTEMYNYHLKVEVEQNKEQLLLAFINKIFKSNGTQYINKLENFQNVRCDHLTFNKISNKISQQINKTFNINLEDKTNDKNNNGAIYIKNIIKQLDGYKFVCSKKSVGPSALNENKKISYTVYSIVRE